MKAVGRVIGIKIKQANSKDMRKNIGPVDRFLRLVIGVVALGLGFYYGSWLGLLGLIPLATAAIGWCPLYSILGITTKKENVSE